MSENRRAVLLLSGGLDSTTVLAIALAEGLDVTALSFRYGQNHVHEAEQAKRIARKYDVDDHVIVDIAVPKHDNHEAIPEGIPVTYVPARNTIFLSYALAMAEVRRADCIMLGVNALDYSGYPDCRPEYVNSFERMANLATKRAIEGRRLEIWAPLMNLTKAQIIEKGIALGVDYSLTTSCYDPDEDNRACGFCDACLLRRRGFEANGLEDPTIYQV